MDNIDNLITTCESLMINTTALEGTNKDVKGLLKSYNEKFKELDTQMIENIKIKKWSKVRPLIKENEKLTKELIAEIGDVEESGIKNILSLLNIGFTVGKLVQSKKVKMWKEEGYKQKGLGSFTKQMAYKMAKGRMDLINDATNNIRGLKDGEELVLPK